jgi:protein-L-isoaspartate(D-aspartate) O-methyltransferase
MLVTWPWQERAARLADELVAAGKLRSPAWRAAVEATPRHVLVPEWFVRDATTGDWVRHELADDADLDLVYSNAALFILPDGLSSSSMPGLMTRMLDELDVRDGHRVLEIGTGAGYNAALLCHRLGGAGVYSVDIEPGLVARARERMATLGHHPTLRATDGTTGLPEGAPFDRVIATCSVPRIPPAWIEQTSAGGRILADLKIGKQAGNLVNLVRTGDGADGRFDPTFGSFMALRDRVPPVPAPTPSGLLERTSRLDLDRPWENTVVWFLAALTMPRVTGFGLRAERGRTALDVVTLSASDGSRAEIGPFGDGVRTVREQGRPLWVHVERAHARWIALGRPGWERFGLTVRDGHHTVWLDDPGGHSWTLPAVPRP